MTGHSLKPVGEWLGGSFGQLRGRWVTLSALFVFGGSALLLAVAMVYGLGFAFFGFIQGWDNVMRVITDPRKVRYLLEESRGAFTLLNLLAAFVLPGIILAVWLGFALWAFARDGAGVFQSLGDSARAVKGHFFGVLGRMLLAGLAGGAMMIVPLIGWLVGAAWIFLAWGHLYTDLRGLSMPAKRSIRPSQVARMVTA